MRPEFQAILLLADPRPSPSSLARFEQLLRGRFDWSLFVCTCEEQALAPFIFFQLRRLGLYTLVPTDPAFRLRDAYETAARHNTILLQDLQRVGEAFHRHGITWLPIGGTALVSRGFFPDRGLHALRFLDLMIHPDATQQAIHVLKSEGFRRLEAETWVNPRGTRLQLNTSVEGFRGRLNLRDFQSNFLACLHDQLLREAQGEGGNALRAHVNLWFLNAALRPARRIRQAPDLSTARLRNLLARQTNNHGSFHGWLRPLFSTRTEMRHHPAETATRFGLVRLYARRLLPLLRHSLRSYLGREAG